MAWFNEIFQRARRPLHLREYAKFTPPMECDRVYLTAPRIEQYVLSMLVRRELEDAFSVPNSLVWLVPLLERCERIQVAAEAPRPFVYVTVQHGKVRSKTDDEWHVDGFSARLPTLPDLNYICVLSGAGTEVLRQPFDFPPDFDPLAHNVNQYLQDRANERLAYRLPPQRLYLLDSYMVHRQSVDIEYRERTFVRISFLELEIRNDTCTPNPLLPAGPYNRADVRRQLCRYPA